MVWTKPVIIEPSASSGSRLSSTEDTNPPMLAVIPSRTSPRGTAALRTFAAVCTTVFSMFTPTRMTENTPSNVFLMFAAVLSEMMSFWVSRSNRSAIV